MWGQRVKQWLPHAHYYEISPCGHCPHHETSTAVNELLSGWVRSIEVRTTCRVRVRLYGVLK
jgi:pimeloyl-ACP methyl ester carboxylesterase